MRKAFESVSLLSTYALAANQTSYHPFVGEHAEAGMVDHGDGRVSTRLSPTAAPFNKYESLLIKDDSLFRNDAHRRAENQPTTLYEALFSTSEETHPRDGPMAEKYRNRAKNQNKRFRLGTQRIEHELVNEDGTMWTGEIYMGGTTLMDVVYDTGSDWVVVEGAECRNC